MGGGHGSPMAGGSRKQSPSMWPVIPLFGSFQESFNNISLLDPPRGQGFRHWEYLQTQMCGCLCICAYALIKYLYIAYGLRYCRYIGKARVIINDGEPDEQVIGHDMETGIMWGYIGAVGGKSPSYSHVVYYRSRFQEYCIRRVFRHVLTGLGTQAKGVREGCPELWMLGRGIFPRRATAPINIILTTTTSTTTTTTSTTSTSTSTTTTTTTTTIILLLLLSLLLLLLLL